MQPMTMSSVRLVFGSCREIQKRQDGGERDSEQFRTPALGEVNDRLHTDSYLQY